MKKKAGIGGARDQCWPKGARRAIVAVAIVAIAAALGGCAAPQTQAPQADTAAAQLEARKQRELVVRSFAEAGWRLSDVGYRVLTAGADLCGDLRSHRIGLNVWNVAAFQDEWREAAASLYGLSSLAEVAHVVPGSPASAAGLRAGDLLLAIDDWQVPTGEGSVAAVSKELRRRLEPGRPITVRVRRGGETLALGVTPVPACDVELALEEGDDKNAYTDGKRIVVFRGMLEFAKTDTELAVVLSHELAHDAMRHIRAQQQNAVVGGLFGLVIDVLAAAGGVNTQGEFTKIGMQAGAAAYSVGFEQEADYVGMYILARAGYPIEEAPALWRRMAVMNPKAIQLRATHPTTPERFVALEKTVEEIRVKQANRMPVFPDRKPPGTGGAGGGGVKAFGRDD